MSGKTREPIRLLRVYPDRRTTYKTVPIKSSTTAGDLRDIIAKKFLLTAEEADDYVILLLTQRRPEGREMSSGSSTVSPTVDKSSALVTQKKERWRSTTGAKINCLRRNWDSARTLRPDENLMTIILEDRRLRWPGKPEPQSAANSDTSTHHQGFDNNEYLMFIFKNGRIPLDVGNEFCGSSGEEEEMEEMEEMEGLEKNAGNDEIRKDGGIQNINGGGGQNLGESNDVLESKGDTNLEQTLHKDEQLHAEDGNTGPSLDQVDLNGLCKRINASQRFILGLPLDPQRRIPYQPRRPSNWKSSVQHWSPENLVDVTMYGLKDEGGSLPMKSLITPSRTRNNSSANSSGAVATVVTAATTTTTSSGGFSGYLLRRSQDQELVWYRRWCVIRDDTFWWCKSRHNQRHIVKIPLTNIDVKLSPNARKHRSMRYCFEIEINTTGCIYMFRARDSNERDLWLNALNEHIRVSHQNERVKLAEVIISDQEYRTSQSDESRLDRVSSSLTCLLKDEEARKIFAQCMREWHCEEALYFYCDVEDWRIFAEQLEADINESSENKLQDNNMKEGSIIDPETCGTSPSVTTKRDTTGTSFRMGSGRFQASVSTLWEQREQRRDQLSFRARALELWDRAQAIFDMFMNSKTAEYEVLLEISEKNKVKQILDTHHRSIRNKEEKNVANNEGSPNQCLTPMPSSVSNIELPPVDLFGNVQASVMEDMKKGAYQRLIGSSVGRRRLALLSVFNPDP